MTIVNPYAKKRVPGNSNKTATVSNKTATTVSNHVQKSPLPSTVTPRKPPPITTATTTATTTTTAAKTTSTPVVNRTAASDARTVTPKSTTKKKLPPAHKLPKSMMALAKATTSFKKAPTTLKQQLKQQIQSLKRHKQLLKSQKLDQERSRVLQQQREEKERERQVFWQQKQEEKQARERARLLEQQRRHEEAKRYQELRQQEKLRKQEERRQREAEKQKERERKQEEKRQKEAEKLARQQQEHQEYLQKHQQWVQQKQAWMQRRQAYLQYHQQMQHQMHLNGGNFGATAFYGTYNTPSIPLVSNATPAAVLPSQPMNNLGTPLLPKTAQTNSPQTTAGLSTVSIPIAPIALATAAAPQIPTHPVAALTTVGQQVHGRTSVNIPTSPSANVSDVKAPMDRGPTPTTNAVHTLQVHPKPSVVNQVVPNAAPYMRNPYSGMVAATVYGPQPSNSMTPASRFPAYGIPRFSFPPMYLPPPPPPPPIPSFLRPKRPSRPKTIKPVKFDVLQDPMKPPSPFSHGTHTLVTIVLVRSVDEKSFGVNLKSFNQSTLVDPEWWEQQQKQKLLPPNLKTLNSKDVVSETKTIVSNNADDDDDSTIRAPTANALENISVASNVKKAPTVDNVVPMARDSKETSLVEKEADLKTDNVAPEIKTVPDGATKGPKENAIVDVIVANNQSETKPLESNNPQDCPLGEEIIAEKSHTDTLLSTALYSKQPGVSLNSESTTLTSKDDSITELESLKRVSEKTDVTTNNESGANAAFSRGSNDPAPMAVETTKTVELGTTKIDPNGMPNSQSPGTLKVESKSMDTEKVSDAEAKLLPTTPSASVNQQRRRRRRVNFTFMVIVDAEKQNARRSGCDEPLLQPEDIVVSIGGTQIAGMTFAQACSIFAIKSENNGDHEIRNTLVVARRKPKPVKPLPALSLPTKPQKTADADKGTVSIAPTPDISISLAKPAPPVTLLSLPANSSMNFECNEIAVLTDSLFAAIHHPNRLLGQPLSEDVFGQTSSIFRQVAALKECSLAHRSVETLQSKWKELAQTFDMTLSDSAREYWTKALKEESGESLPFSSDAERSMLRQMPRPARGCRCKSRTHEYVHDPKCSLYRDLRRHLTEEELSEFLYKDTLKKKGPKDLNAVEAAFKDRILKLKTSAEMEDMEARFVARMEEIQVKELKKAVFAPTLSAMVLSTIFELQRQFPIQHIPEVIVDEDESDDEEELNDECDEENVPLMDLRKRKKQKTKADPTISPKYLISMLHYISKTWGAVYREPSHEEYAWRWEVYHGHNSENVQWESQTTNPRTPNTLPFENIRFGDVKCDVELSAFRVKISDFEQSVKRELGRLTKQELERVTALAAPSVSDTATVDAAAPGALSKDSSENSPKDGRDKISGAENTESNGTPDEIASKEEPTSELVELNLSKENVEQFCVTTHFLSPSHSGVYDELLAFIKTGIFEISSNGIPILAPDWFSKVDIILLDDLDASWGTASDPDGRYCVNDELRDTLEEQWIKSDYGWAMSDDPKDLVFDFEVLDEWRQTFEGRVEEQANYSEGIGRFGF